MDWRAWWLARISDGGSAGFFTATMLGTPASRFSSALLNEKCVVAGLL
jgi:hypothetical protein